MIQREFRLILTQFCNYRCFFCHCEGAAESFYDSKMTCEDYLFLLSTARRFWGWDTATLTGGEPLISPIYYDLCKLLSAAGIKLTTVTNASLITEPERLRYNSQLNISLHTLDPQTYARITRHNYPLENVLRSIRAIRAQLPQMEIHLNTTVIRGYNHRPEDLLQIIEFAYEIRAIPKFIDLASCTSKLIVSVAEITAALKSLGFQVESDELWQVRLRRLSDSLPAIVTRCGFASTHHQLELRNPLIYSDGTLSSGLPGDATVSLLPEIRGRDSDGLIQKITKYLPSLHN